MKRTHKILPLLLLALATGAGCDSPKTYPFGGEWEGTGTSNGLFLDVTQSGQQIAGTLSGPASSGLFANISGVVANGDVSFSFAQVGTIDGVGGSNSTSWQFTGHFTNQNTVAGSLAMHGGGTTSLTLTRASVDN